MPRLTAVRVTYDARVAEVHFSTTRALMTAADTAVLIVSDPSGSEFGIRLERGAVADAHLWDARRLLRQGLPVSAVTIAEGVVSCPIPVEVLPHLGWPVRLSAALIVNGALVQSGFAVEVAPARESRAELDHATGGNGHG
ncbi:hypothetical protein M2152_002306 [Microbacteriaceae bacterium SG_E_30_P1]|uniref:Uncharacterized protein n=1 Tax=Antiquaquibacter oligotrophicus TaxID=2880260 RepID=A0ABT6KSG2_9MICO|nr:hypothetical protein [Antiquaquibacter oligotrophicus]MDH6182124.1 hypothetical protein [Antiquaquibacter oligotrophicus]UDF12213.1 hypothetical protein LH407_08540 [Antiquaquibacter oligotrophicus]